MDSQVQKRIDEELPRKVYSHPNRIMCTILEEMRDLFKTYNFAPLMSLIEEAQVVADRMESAIDMKRTMVELHKEMHELKQARNKLREECENLIKESQELRTKHEQEVTKYIDTLEKSDVKEKE